ncbi:MAG: hypothetical protein ND866_15000 [Pyrinomonadaceae bacterium]|nr:hypothetical protein [Pyrinomonadaceae bacterium]
MKARLRKGPGLYFDANLGILDQRSMFPRSSQKTRSGLMPKLTTNLVTPITDFTLACDRLLNDPITRDALTKDELDLLKMCVQRLTVRFQLAG